MASLITPKNHPTRVVFGLRAFFLNLQKRYFQTSVVAAILASLFSVIVVSPAAADGTTWTSQSTPVAEVSYKSVTFGAVGGGVSRFVAVGDNGDGNRVLTSTNGTDWAASGSSVHGWQSVTYGTVGGVGTFVAVGDACCAYVKSSTNGTSWSGRTTAANNNWQSVTYGDGLFVAVSSSGTGNRVMTSPDGINWTSRTSAADNAWQSVTYGTVGGVGTFVAVSSTGIQNRVMTSRLRAPAFTLTSSSETRTVNTSATGFTINSTGGAIASFSISATPPGMSFDTTTGALTGTPSTVASATTYTVTATNASGNATQTFALTVTAALAAPAFTLSSSSESRTVNTAATGFTTSSTGGAIASFAINATPPGMSFNTTTGALTGTPNTVAPATTYTVTATNASGNATQTFALTVTDAPVNNSGAQAAAQAEAAKKQKELLELLSIIPSLGSIALNLGETTKALSQQKCVKKMQVKYVKKGAKCPKGFVRK